MSKSETSPAATTVYFDGKCHLCSSEVSFYQQQEAQCPLRFVDITDQEFNADNEGLNERKVHESLHVRGADGKIYVAVEAFRYLWSQMPNFRWAHRVSGFPPINLALKGLYGVFRRLRPYLPKRKK